MKEEIKSSIDQFGNIKALVIGDAILDTYIKGNSERLCREAPVPVINVKEYGYSCGGAANTAINVAALGAQTWFLSVIGKDETGDQLIQVLRKNKVNAECIIRDKNRKTLSKKRITAASSMLLRIDEGSTYETGLATEKELREKLIRIYKKVDVIILSDYGYGTISEGIIALLKTLRETKRKPLVIDSKNLVRFRDLKPDAVKPNYEESLNLLDISAKEDIERLYQIAANGNRLLDITGACCVMATLDADGTLVFEKEKCSRVFTSPQDNKKSIGAGDTFIGGLALALCTGAEPAIAAEIASGAASVVLQHEGTVVCTSDNLKEYFSDTPKFLASLNDLDQKIALLRKGEKKIVFTNGCFDILHRGHVNLLNKAAELGDVLIVGINSDESIRRLKGPQRPVNSLEDRIIVLAGLQSVDYLMAFEEDSPSEIIKALKPDFFVKGGDYSANSIPETALVNSFGGQIKIIPLVENHSTTLIIEKIREGNHFIVPEKYEYAKASG